MNLVLQVLSSDLNTSIVETTVYPLVIRLHTQNKTVAEQSPSLKQSIFWCSLLVYQTIHVSVVCLPLVPCVSTCLSTKIFWPTFSCKHWSQEHCVVEHEGKCPNADWLQPPVSKYYNSVSSLMFSPADSRHCPPMSPLSSWTHVHWWTHSKDDKPANNSVDPEEAKLLKVTKFLSQKPQNQDMKWCTLRSDPCSSSEVLQWSQVLKIHICDHSVNRNGKESWWTHLYLSILLSRLKSLVYLLTLNMPSTGFHCNSSIMI